MFGCHESGTERPATYAEFLLRGATHNMAVRMACSRGRIDLDQVVDGGYELWESYTDMSIANGVDPDDPALYGCRS